MFIFLFEPTSFARSPVEVGCVVVGMCVQKGGQKRRRIRIIGMESITCFYLFLFFHSRLLVCVLMLCFESIVSLFRFLCIFGFLLFFFIFFFFISQKGRDRDFWCPSTLVLRRLVNTNFSGQSCPPPQSHLFSDLGG